MPGANSSTVEERIVEMRIDHDKFEAGAKKTIDILEKLDNGLKSLGKENTDGFDSVGRSLDKVTDRFSAMGIVGDQVIRTLTNKAMDLVGQLGKVATALSVDQIGVGWGKYAEKTQGVQTIMAATAKDWENQGAQIEWVNSQLEKLNLFTDETSYNFLDMVNNIGKFTSNGVKLETAVTAMEGISNWAAISGGTINEAGRAMYNLSQALAVGSVKLMDWKSIENANMATREFKETALETAVALGTLTKRGNAFVTKAGHSFTAEQFNTQLSDGWFSSDVLLEVLNTYGKFTDVLLATSEETGETVTELLRMVDVYKETGKASDDLLPYIKELSKEEYDLGRRAFKAAQEAKTFQEAIDATKDAVSTGWMNLFETMFGNYLTAKDFWTGVANSLYDIFAEPINKLNDIFDIAFNGPNPLRELLADAGSSMSEMEEAAQKVADDTLTAFGGSFQSYGVRNLIEQYGSLEEAIKAGAVTAEQFQAILDQMNLDRLDKIVNGKNDDFNKKIDDIKQNAEWFLDGAVSKETLEARGYDVSMIEWWANVIERQTTEAKAAAESIQSSKDATVVDLKKAQALLEKGGYTFEDFDIAASKLGDSGLEKLITKYGSLQAAMEQGVVSVDQFMEAYLSMTEESGDPYLVQFMDQYSDQLLKLAGYTDEEIEKLHELGLASEEVLSLMTDEKVTRESGFKLFTESLQNLLDVFSAVSEAARKAFNIIFGGTDEETNEDIANENVAERIYQLVKRFHDFTESLEITEDKAKALRDKFVSLFEAFSSIGSVTDLIKGILGGIFNIAVRLFNTLRESGIFKAIISSVLTLLQALLIPLELIVVGIMTLIDKGKELGKQAWAQTLSEWLGVIADKITAVADRFKEFMSSTTVSTWITTALTKIAGILSTIGNAVKSVFGNISKYFKLFRREFSINGLIGVLELFGRLIRDKVVGIFDGIKSAFDAGGIKEVFKFIIERIVAFFNKSVDFTAITESIGTFISNAVSKVGTFLFGKLDATKVTQIADAIRNFFTGIFGNIGGFFSKTFDFSTLGETIRSLGETISGAFDNFGKFISSKISFENIGETISSFLKMLGTIAKDALPLIKVATISYTLISIAQWSRALRWAVESVSEFAEGLKIGAVAGLIGSLASLILSIGVVIKILSTIPKNKMQIAIDGLIGAGLVLVGIIGLVSLINLLPGGISTKAMWSLVPVALAIGIIVAALAVLGHMDPASLLQGWLALSTILTQIITFTLFSGNVKKKGLGDILKIAIGVWLVANALQRLGNMDMKQLLKGWLGLKLVMDQMIRFTKRSKGLGWDTNFDKLLYVAAGVWLLAKSMKGLGDMDFAEILKGWIGLSLIMNQMIRFTKKSSRVNNGKELFGLIGVALTLAVLVGAFKRLGDMNFTSIMKAAIAMFILVGSLVRVMQGTFSKGVGNSLFSERQSINGKQLWGLIAVAITVAALAEVMARIGSLPVEQIVKGLLGLGAIMFALGKFLDSMKGSFQTGAIKKIVASLAIIGIIVAASAALHKLSRLPSKQLASAAGALSVVLLALGGTMALISKFGSGFNLAAVASLAVGIGALWLVGEILVPFGESNLDWDKIGKAALICIGTIVGIAGAAVLLGKIPTGGAVKGIVGIGAIFAAIEIVLLALMAIGLAVISVAISMANKLSDFTAALNPFLESIKSYDDSTVENLSRFADMMGKLALAELFTALAAALALVPSAALFEDLKSLGKAVKEFVTDISEFTGDDISKIETFSGVMQSIAGITGWEAIGTILAAISDVFNETASDESGGDKSRLFENLTELIKGFARFSTELAEVDFAGGIEKKVQTFASIMQALTEVELWNVIATMMNSLGNAVGALGDKFGPTFIENMSNLATGVADFANAIDSKDFPKKAESKIKDFVSIMQLLATITAWDAAGKMITALGNAVGTAYSNQLVALPQTIGDFVTAIEKANIKSGTEEKIRTFSNIMQSLGMITGWDMLAKMFTALGNAVKTAWSNQLIQLPTAVAGFVGSLEAASISDDAPGKIKSFGNVMQEITAITGWSTLADIIAWISPTNGDGQHAIAALADFTDGFPRFLENISTLTDDDLSQFEKFEESVSKIVSAKIWSTTWSGMSEDEMGKMTALGETLSTFGDQFIPFLNKFSGASVENVQKFVDSFAVLKNIKDFNLIAGLIDQIQMLFFDLSATGVDMGLTAELISSMAEIVSSVSGLGSDIMASIASGVTSSRDTVKDAIVVAVRGAVVLACTDGEVIMTANTLSVTIGEDIGNGIANGIAASTATCVSAAVALASAINSAFASSLEIRSPSRVFARLASFIPAGVAQGIEENTGTAVDSITIMSSGILAAMQQAMMNVATIADDSFEYNPMITPVVDMSNVTDAAGSAGGMFGTVGMALRASSRVSMDTAQNTAAAVTYGGGADSIVSELQRMGSRLDNLGEAITNMKIVLDSGELVGATSRQMDDAFGTLQMRKGRGN